MSETVFASSSPSPTSQSSNPQPSSPSGTASSLYLYTFLATLVLLLGVSAAIVLRSMALRMRHRRMIEEAIRNGTYIPPSARPVFHAADKPKIYDVYVEEGEVGKWDGVLPISASVLPAPSKPSSQSASSPNLHSSPNANNNSRALTRRFGLSNISAHLSVLRSMGHELRAYYFPRRLTSESLLNLGDVEAAASGTANNAAVNSTPALTPAQMQEAKLAQLGSGGGDVGVTVLIAMPSISHHNHALNHSHSHEHSHASSSDEKKDLRQSRQSFGYGYSSADHGLPHLEFGVARVEVRPSSDPEVGNGVSGKGM